MGEVASLCAEFLDHEEDIQTRPREEITSAMKLVADKATKLVSDFEKLELDLPRAFAYSVVRRDKFVLAPWLEGTIKDPAAPLFVLLYKNMTIAFFWNCMRSAQLRLHQVMYKTYLVLRNEPCRHQSAEVMKGLIEEIGCTVASYFVPFTDGTVGANDGYDVCTIRVYLLVRPLVMARLCLKTLVGEWSAAKEKMRWLEDTLTGLKEEFGMGTPAAPDPLSKSDIWPVENANEVEPMTKKLEEMDRVQQQQDGYLNLQLENEANAGDGAIVISES